MRQLLNDIRVIIQNIDILINYQKQNNIVYRESVIQELLSQITNILQNQTIFNEEEMDINYLNNTLDEMLNALSRKDYILFVDYTKLRLRPFFVNLCEVICNKTPLPDYYAGNLERLKNRDNVLYEALSKYETIRENSSYSGYEYQPMYDCAGGITITVIGDGISKTLYSYDDSYVSCMDRVNEQYDPTINSYIMLGLGLGYHAKLLLEKDLPGEIRLKIIENDLGIIKQAMTLMDMSWYFDNPSVELIYDDKWSGLGDALSEKDSKLFINYEAVDCIADKRVRELIEQIVLIKTNAMAWQDKMIQNFVSNIRVANSDIEDIRRIISGKKAIIVGAGPSLDKNINELKNVPEDCNIVAFGAVARKLVNNSIIPDIIIVSDPKPWTAAQLEGINDLNVPLVVLSTTCKGVAKNYQGNKYVLMQEGEKSAKEYAKEHGCMLFETAGSVSTVALDMCIKLGASKIILAGQDLAFANGKNHAEGTRQDYVLDYGVLECVEGIDGQQVYVTKPFAKYREWIERRIEREDVSIPIVNATEGGARIKGTKECTLHTALMI